jgi:hypothetical protein
MLSFFHSKKGGMQCTEMIPGKQRASSQSIMPIMIILKADGMPSLLRSEKSSRHTSRIPENLYPIHTNVEITTCFVYPGIAMQR